MQPIIIINVYIIIIIVVVVVVVVRRAERQRNICYRLYSVPIFRASDKDSKCRKL